MKLFEELQERGLIAQMTNPELIKQKLNEEKTTFYMGFDATANSLHVGHFFVLMMIKRLQMAGHKPILLLGTGTTMVGDPSGKTDMRKMLTVEEINENADKFAAQMSKYIDMSDDKAMFLKNGDWLMALNYIELLRDVGVHFSINRMLAAECYKSRLESGLTFLELNYMIMQSYDFWHQFKHHNCTLQLGGDDQWSNIIHGVDLVRRKEAKEVCGMTFTLLTNTDGVKMGKTEKGAIWLDKERTSPYEFFQYWRNVEDAKVIEVLKMLTFLPLDEINEMSKWEGSELNKAKEILAFEATKLVHGEEEANKALETAKAIFAGNMGTENMPSTVISSDNFTDGAIDILEVLVLSGLAPSKGEARRLIKQGGISVDDVKVEDAGMKITADKFEGDGIVVRKGKKIYHRVSLG